MKIVGKLILGQLFIYFSLFGQAKSNLMLVDSLLNQSVKIITDGLDKERSFTLKYNCPEEYKSLEGRIISHIQNQGIELVKVSEDAAQINYQLNDANTSYSELFKDGLFGEYLLERKVKTDVSYFFVEQNKISKSQNLSFELIDTVLLSEISRLENIAYSFTNSELPEEPLFASTLEPVIAIGTAAIAVYLFFNIRGK